MLVYVNIYFELLVFKLRLNPRLQLAEAMKLTDPEGSHKKILDTVCKNLEDNGMADLEWDESNLVQKTYKQLGLKRYKIDVELIGTVSQKTKESEYMHVLMYSN